MIEYPEGEDLVDHKGRSKPIYKPSSPRPAEWRPGPWARWTMGLFPGLRLMATKNVPAGLPYAILGLLTSLGALLVVLNWSTAMDTIQQLRIQPRWILLRAGAVLLMVGVYELLRMASSLEEAPRGPRVPRVLAAFVLPSFLVVLAVPAFLYIAPQWLEAAWVAALVIGFGALPAAVSCVLTRLSSPNLDRLRGGAGIVLATLIAFTILLPLVGVPIFGDLKGAMRAAGFRVVTDLLP